MKVCSTVKHFAVGSLPWRQCWWRISQLDGPVLPLEVLELTEVLRHNSHIDGVLVSSCSCNNTNLSLCFKQHPCINFQFCRSDFLKSRCWPDCSLWRFWVRICFRAFSGFLETAYVLGFVAPLVIVQASRLALSNLSIWPLLPLSHVLFWLWPTPLPPSSEGPRDYIGSLG